MTKEQCFLIGKNAITYAYKDYRFIYDNRWEKRFEEYAEFYNQYVEIEKLYNPGNAYDLYLYHYYSKMCELFREFFLNSYMLDNGYSYNPCKERYVKVVK